MKRVIYFIILIFWIPVMGSAAFCAEAYYINNNHVLLYKIINWWYDCLAEESELLCESTIKCRVQDDIRIKYNVAEMKLAIGIPGGFAHQLSLLGPLSNSYELACTSLNRTYFSKSEAKNISGGLPILGALVIHRVGKTQGLQIQRMEKDIVFELDGIISGLVNGKIALNHKGSFIKTCPDAARTGAPGFPVHLRIMNSNTKEVLATYAAVF